MVVVIYVYEWIMYLDNNILSTQERSPSWVCQAICISWFIAKTNAFILIPYTSIPIGCVICGISSNLYCNIMCECSITNKGGHFILCHLWHVSKVMTNVMVRNSDTMVVIRLFWCDAFQQNIKCQWNRM